MKRVPYVRAENYEQKVYKEFINRKYSYNTIKQELLTVVFFHNVKDLTKSVLALRYKY